MSLFLCDKKAQTQNKNRDIKCGTDKGSSCHWSDKHRNTERFSGYPLMKKKQTKQTKKPCCISQPLQTLHGQYFVRLHLLCCCRCYFLPMSNSPFLSPKKRVCCAGFDHWREVLSLYSTRQVRFAVPPSVTVIFWTRGYWPLMPATWHIGERIMWGDEDESRESERKIQN